MSELSGKQLKERIAGLAKRKGYYMKDVAKYIDLTADGLNLALLKQTISYSKLQMIAKLFEMDVSILLSTSEIKTKDEYKDKYLAALEENQKLYREVRDLREKYEKSESQHNVKSANGIS